VAWGAGLPADDGPADAEPDDGPADPAPCDEAVDPAPCDEPADPAPTPPLPERFAAGALVPGPAVVAVGPPVETTEAWAAGCS
jgi:hypothetical protein